MTNQTKSLPIWLVAPKVTFLTSDCREGIVLRQDGENTIVTYDGGKTEVPEPAAMEVTIAC